VLVMADAGEDNLLHAIERDEAWLAELMRALSRAGVPFAGSGQTAGAE
jgi:hypothetical protein